MAQFIVVRKDGTDGGRIRIRKDGMRIGRWVCSRVACMARPMAPCRLGTARLRADALRRQFGAL
jgi:hypothetical protein